MKLITENKETKVYREFSFTYWELLELIKEKIPNFIEGSTVSITLEGSASETLDVEDQFTVSISHSE